MRAICDSCSRPQPPDWRAGDQCIWCGQAVRREVRCFWCANWTPAVKFCRTCGAATVDSALYGAARMLKDAGCDRFTVPRQLAEFEPDQVENFTRIYQEHAAVAAHHVEQVEFLERYLEQKHWSGALDQSLVVQLPWPLDRLEAMRAATRRVPAQADPLDKARAIGEASPFHTTQLLSSIARLALEDWSALDDAVLMIGNPEETIRTEAVLAASHWRVLYGPGLTSSRRYQIIDELRRCPLHDAASVRLALLGEPTGQPLPPGDFATALIDGDIDSLSTATRDLGDPHRRFAAAQKLIALDVLLPVASILPDAREEQQIALLQLLDRHRKLAPELRETLFDLARDTKSERVHQFACCLLCYGCPPGEALRIADAARGDRQIYQALLQRAGLPPGALEELGEYLLRTGAFTMSQYGLADAAKPDRMPADFVPKYWRDATPDARIELCKFAEVQLAAREDAALHRFLVDIAFTPADPKVQSQAWSGLYRWYDSFGYPRRRPLKVSAESIVTLFGSAPQFLNRFAAFLDARAILHESIHRDAVAEILRYPDASALPLIAQSPRETMTLVEAVSGVMRDPEVDFTIRLACTDFLGFLSSEPTLRRPLTRALRSFLGTDLDLQSKRALGLWPYSCG
jgi:hypothetical protein